MRKSKLIRLREISQEFNELLCRKEIIEDHEYDFAYILELNSIIKGLPLEGLDFNMPIINHKSLIGLWATTHILFPGINVSYKEEFIEGDKRYVRYHSRVPLVSDKLPLDVGVEVYQYLDEFCEKFIDYLEETLIHHKSVKNKDSNETE